MHLPAKPCCLPVTYSYSGCDSCTETPIPTNGISYSGPNLPCTGIKTCDSLTVSLEKVDNEICILKNQIVVLQNLVNSLTTTTTTTTLILT